MRRRFLPSIPQSLTVFLFWMLMSQSVDVANFLMALVLAIVMPLIAARLEREFARMGQLRHIPGLVVHLLWDILRANLTVARQVLGPRDRLQSQFIWVPLDLTNIHGISALASIITLTPGKVSAELSPDRRYLLVHCFNLKDAQAKIDEIKRRYEGALFEIFP